MKELTKLMFNVANFQKILGEFSTSQLDAFRREIETARHMTNEQILFICTVKGFSPQYVSAREEDIRNELDRRWCMADSWIRGDDSVCESPSKKRKIAC
tara:strand:+ start:3676 stop:3972 length:297 start_codon:yes stop_codon:yes gene_type:complete